MCSTFTSLRTLCFVLLVLSLWGSPALAKSRQTQLLFEVKTNFDKSKRYAFEVVTKGPNKRLLGIRSYRTTQRKHAPHQHHNDPCHTSFMSLNTLQQGVTLLRQAKSFTYSPSFRKLMLEKQAGTQWTAHKERLLQTLQKAECARWKKANSGRIVNAFRAYGWQPGQGLHPLKGGVIIVTYLNNALLKFFRGKYNIAILQLKRVPVVKGKKKSWQWTLLTLSNRPITKAYYRTYTLGISGIEKNWTPQAKGKYLPAWDCKGSTDMTGNCIFIPKQLISLFDQHIDTPTSG